MSGSNPTEEQGIAAMVRAMRDFARSYAVNPSRREEDRSMVSALVAGARTDVRVYPTEEQGIAAMVRAMRDFARSYAVNPRILAWARDAVRFCPALDARCEARAVYDALDSFAVRYTRDPRHVDILANPEYVLETGGGDCDDLTTLYAAAMLALGARVRFGLGSRTAPVPTHVLPFVLLPEGWVPVEVSSRVVPFGTLATRFRLMAQVEV